MRDIMKIAVPSSGYNPAAIGEDASLAPRTHLVKKLIRKYRISAPMAHVVAELAFNVGEARR